MNLSEKDYKRILLKYNLGKLKNWRIIKTGTVQTNCLIETFKGKFVIRFYNFRSIESIKFEINLINYILRRKYPTASPIKGKNKKYLNFFKRMTYVLFVFIKGKHICDTSQKQFENIVKAAALLNNMTKNYHPKYRKYRWNYSPSFCKDIASKKSRELGTFNAKKKYEWIKNELGKLELPSSLPKGVCHCDFHYTNVLFNKNELVALIDFDDANYTYLTYDLASLINPFKQGFNWNTWTSFNQYKEIVSLDNSKKVAGLYNKYRKLNPVEKNHLYDVLKLSILIDSLWFFERGNFEDFFEKRKIEALNKLGRKEFFHRLFT